MIIFKSIKWRNFLSTGNQFTEIKLDKSLSTLIVGTNGAGKSTFVDGICFALYGKPFRSINKGQLVNSINRKELEVQIEFSVGTKEYKIIRGIKPNKFEIYIGDELINQDAASKDYQAYLEENILKLNYKSFTQNSILASAQYIPFMQLPAASRREVIEDLLDISVFSKMNEVLKSRLSTFKTELSDIERDKEVTEMKLDTQIKYIETLERNSKERVTQIDLEIQTINVKIQTCKNDIQKLEAEESKLSDPRIEEIEQKIVKKQEKRDKLSEASNELLSRKDECTKDLLKPIDNPEILEIEKQIKQVSLELVELNTIKDNFIKQKNELTREFLKPIKSDELALFQDGIRTNNESIQIAKSEITQLTYERDKVEKEIQFFENNETCPTCTQTISDKFKAETLDTHRKSIDEANTKIQSRRDYINTLTTTNQDLNDRHDELKKQLDDERKEKLSSIDASIEETDVEFQRMSTHLNVITSSYNSLKEKLNEDKTAYLRDIDTALTDANSRLKDVETEIKTLANDKNDISKQLDTKKLEVRTSINKLVSMMEYEDNYAKRIELEKENILSKNDDFQVEMTKKEAFEVNIKMLEEMYNQKHIEKKYIDTGILIMKDTGIKTSIIKQYVPIINKLINSYLQIMDLFVEYELDETFNEKIKSRNRDDFSYASFSEGEKARIDLAILFTFRSIAKMKSTSCTNLLLLDETFDGSIDADGADSIGAILKTLQDSNVFCVSHSEKMMDKFRSLIKFDKIQNYSVIV